MSVTGIHILLDNVKVTMLKFDEFLDELFVRAPSFTLPRGVLNSGVLTDVFVE